MMRKTLGVLILTSAVVANSAAETVVPTTFVGIAGRMEVALDGTELEVAPVPNPPVRLRIVETYPHGSAFRYSLEYFGLEPGEYNLIDYLRRKDGSAKDALSPLTVKFVSSLPGRAMALPHEPRVGSMPWLGGYRLTWIAVGVVWVAGLLLILLWGRDWSRSTSAQAASPVTLAEQLRPLVERAMSGRATSSELASLEQFLLTFWRKHLGVEHLNPSQAMARLKADPDAGALVRQLEEWLHAPSRVGASDLETLLAPYRDMPSEETQTAGARA